MQELVATLNPRPEPISDCVIGDKRMAYHEYRRIDVLEWQTDQGFFLIAGSSAYRLLHCLPLTGCALSLMIDVAGEIRGTDEPGRFLGADAIGRNRQLLHRGAPLRLRHGQAKVFLAHLFERNLRRSKLGQEAEIRWGHHLIVLPNAGQRNRI